MKIKIISVLLLIFFGAFAALFAQQTQPARRLPPSLEKELRLRIGIVPRVVSFSDTLKAKQILSQSFRDTAGTELDSAHVRDSAVVILDSAVSLSHKQALDSLLAELPEFSATKEGVRFNYPSAMLVETQAKVAPFDSTLLPQMEPVTKEPISYLDAFPFQRPLHEERNSRSFIEAGLGMPVLPDVSADISLYRTEETQLALGGYFKNMLASYSALRTSWDAVFTSDFYFPHEDREMGSRIPHLNINASLGERTREIKTRRESPLFTQSFTGLRANFKAGEPKGLLFSANGAIEEFSERAGKDFSEFVAAFDLEGVKALTRGETDLLTLRLGFRSAGIADLGAPAESSSPSAFIVKGFYSSRTNDPFEWDGGLQFVGGTSVSQVTPYISIKRRFSELFTAGASFAPEAGITTYRSLTNENPFYSRALAIKANDSLSVIDPRSVVTEKLRIDLFGEYFISIDDHVRVSIGYAEKNNDPVFFDVKDSGGNPVFSVSGKETRTFDLALGGKLLLFESDEFTADIDYISSTVKNEEKALPFVPSMNLQLGYTFNSISRTLKPRAELRYLARTDRSITLVNVEVSYPLSEQMALRLRAENLFGNPSDYWSGYTEYPRSIFLGIRAAF